MSSRLPSCIADLAPQDGHTDWLDGRQENEMTELVGQNVVITGAGSGLGAAWGRAAARLGARIVVNDIDHETALRTVAEIVAEGGEAVAEVQDISDPAGAAAVVARCIESFGSITCLINNAAVFSTEPVWDADVDKLRRALDVNVIGSFNCMRHAVGPMMAQKSGSIINVISGAHMGLPALGHYGATKGALASFTYSWASDLVGTGVRVNAISPLALTPMSAHVPTLPPCEVNVPPLLYLISDRSSHLNGQIVRIAGTQLSIIAHPAIRTPVLENDEWTLDSVADAFDATLTAKLVPLGVATYDIAGIA
jgi:NAD(P)-dependent dehydrogenase (short-subunit alcohol dehydrogenase family)